jgi:hypothetical protein
MKLFSVILSEILSDGLLWLEGEASMFVLVISV